MNIVITGANGFVGQGLLDTLRHRPYLGNHPIHQVYLIDHTMSTQDHTSTPFQVYVCQGDITDRQWLDTQLGSLEFDALFHLASIPGGMAEQNESLAYQVNVTATRHLLEICQAQTQRGQRLPRFIFASSIAVFGDLSHAYQTQHIVSDDTPVQPTMSYGSHKRIGEVMIDDFTRRGWVDGRSLRIPGVFARPPAKTGQLTAFFSDLIREVAAGKPFVCPLPAKATTWGSSRANVIDNLIHAANIDATLLTANRTYTLPTCYFKMDDLVTAISDAYQVDGHQLVKYQADDKLTELFGQYPQLSTTRAEQVGFRPDDNLQTFVKKALLN